MEEKDIIEKLNTLLKTQQKQLIKKEKNKNCSIIKKISLLILFEKIFIYLDLKDINNFSLSCKTLKNSIYSTYGFYLICSTKIQCNLKYIKKEVVDKISIILKEVDKEEIKNKKTGIIRNSLSKIIDLPETQKVEKISTSFFSYFNNSENTKTEQDSETIKILKKYLDDQLKHFSTSLKKMEIKNMKFQEIVENNKIENSELLEVIDEHKQTIKDLNMRYHQLLLDKEKEILKVRKENGVLRSHRGVLAREIVNLRETLGKSESEKLQFFESLISINKALV